MNTRVALNVLLVLTIVAVLGSSVMTAPYQVLAQGPDPVGPEGALGTAFTYQGRLVKDGTPVDDTCDMRFALYDASGGGNTVGSAVTVSGVAVSAGYFTTQVDFGVGVFVGDERWMGVEVQCTGCL